jgi:hypothetical protein
MGPPGPQGVPGPVAEGGPFLPIAGGSLDDALGFWGASSTINAYDAQIWATGGATLPGNPGQGEMNYMAGRHIFQTYDGTTQFRVGNMPWAWNWWEAIGGSDDTAATLRAGSDLKPDCDGALVMQGHGQLTLGNGEGTFAVFPSIGKQIVSYFQFIAGGPSDNLTIKAVGGGGLPLAINLTAGSNGSIIGGNANGPLFTVNDPTTYGNPRTSWFSLTAGAAGFRPTIGLSGVANDDIALVASGTGGVVIGNGGGVLGVFADPGSTGVHQYLTFTPGIGGVAPPTISSAGATPCDVRITSVDTGTVHISSWHGPIADFSGNASNAINNWFSFQAGVSGASPVLGISGSGNADLRIVPAGTGRVGLFGGGLYFNPLYVSGISDLSKHIDLYNGTTGFNVSTGGGMGICGPVAGSVSFIFGGTSTGYIDHTGINWIPIGQAGQSTGAFTGLYANGVHINGTIGGATDLAHGIDLNNKGTAGINGYADEMYLNAAAGHGFNFYVGGTAIGLINASGICYLPIGASGPTTGTFTTIALNAATTGPTIRAGTGAPSGTAPNGSLWIRTDGANGAHLYVNQTGASTWTAVAGV